MARLTETTKVYQEKTTVSESSLECALAGAVAAISGLKGSAIIIHGPPGCGWTGRWARSDFAIDNWVPLVADNLLQHNLIFGGSQKLRDAAKWAVERWKPKQLFIIAGCAGSLITDPMSEVAAEVEKSSGIPIITLDAPGFKGLVATGMDDAFVKILNRFAENGKESERGSVNLIAPYLMGSANWVYDLTEIRSLLEAIGIKVNCVLTYNTTVDEVGRFNRAQSNIYLTYEELPNLRKYEEEHGLERLGQNLPLPIGAANTERWYLNLAEHFGKGKEASKLLQEQAMSLKYLKFHYNCTWVSTWVSNKYAVIVGPATWAASYANFAYFDMTIYPAVIALYGESKQSMERAKETLADLTKYYAPIILENPLYIQLVEAVKECNPEFAIGQTQEKSLLESHGIPHISLAGLQTVLGGFNFIPYPSVGIKGILYQLTMLARLLEHTFYEPEKWAGLRYCGREARPEDVSPL